MGSTVLDNGKPLLITDNTSGHLGQIDVSLPGEVPIGPDGGEGGLEAYIGVAAFRQRYGADQSKALAKLSPDDPPLQALARAIRICHAIYRPDHICLCGGIGIRLRKLLPALRVNIEQDLTTLARPDWRFTTGDDDHHAARARPRSLQTRDSQCLADPSIIV